ncbi:hypothetical protein LSTR_LSTR003281 [Laodelphax striatellus]|uniref:Uncharacterized protein n=1 Tax=Laodelphax striatellus TaxID=195883 RepID=A0A482XX17_LAOST|nr:hypothetical protein LSTR_LSTR003281 [Laodelphax striatellus]
MTLAVPIKSYPTAYGNRSLTGVRLIINLEEREREKKSPTQRLTGRHILEMDAVITSHLMVRGGGGGWVGLAKRGSSSTGNGKIFRQSVRFENAYRSKRSFNSLGLQMKRCGVVCAFLITAKLDSF